VCNKGWRGRGYKLCKICGIMRSYCTTGSRSNIQRKKMEGRWIEIERGTGRERGTDRSLYTDLYAYKEKHTY
jgi:hypothetical protein